MPIPTNFSTPTRVSAKERAFSQIQEWIIDGTLKPQEKLHDADLAQALGVSRTPIREALQLLNVQGFVEMFPGVGTQVTSVKKEDIAKILPPLGALQALAAEIATPIINEQTIRTLRELNSSFAQAIHRNDFYSALKFDDQYHNLIIETAQNSYISNAVSTLQAHVMRLFHHQSVILTTQSIEEHDAIIEAFEKKDPETASKMARINWTRAIDEFFAEYNQPNE